MRCVKQRLVDRRLEVQLVVRMAQEEGKLPLFLLIAARRAEDKGRPPLIKAERRRQCRARPLSR